MYYLILYHVSTACLWIEAKAENPDTLLTILEKFMYDCREDVQWEIKEVKINKARDEHAET